MVVQNVYGTVTLPVFNEMSVFFRTNQLLKNDLDFRYLKWLEAGGDIVILIREIVPELYANHFISATEHAPYVRRSLLAIGLCESGWSATRSHKANANGTYDWGVLQVNDKNLNSMYFMSLFGVENPTGDWRIDYMIIGVNFFIYLKDTYGTDAHIIYNCGEGAWVKKCIPDSSVIYRQKVENFYNGFEDRLKEIQQEYYLQIASEIWEEHQILLEKIHGLGPYEYRTIPELRIHYLYFGLWLFYDNRQILIIGFDKLKTC